jgi:prepilin-type processing-associated H-X9-DG protein/prepilin-type N-terminal cleavage/methylation domain-containing protein
MTRGNGVYPRHPGARQASGFSLVELLVVIGIIAVLIAMLMPALSTAREQANRIKCASNMRQIGMNMQLYLSQYNGWMPPQTDSIVHFADAVPEFDSLAAIPNPPAASIVNSASAAAQLNTNPPSLLYCPDALVAVAGSQTPTIDSDTSYMPNAAVMATQITNITHSSQIIALTEYMYHTSYLWQRPEANDNGASGSGYTWKQINNDIYFEWHYAPGGIEEYGNNHQNGGNYCYVDGHVEYRQYKGVQSGDYGLQPNQTWSTTNFPNPDGGGNWTLAF